MYMTFVKFYTCLIIFLIALCRERKQTHMYYLSVLLICLLKAVLHSFWGMICANCIFFHVHHWSLQGRLFKCSLKTREIIMLHSQNTYNASRKYILLSAGFSFKTVSVVHFKPVVNQFKLTSKTFNRCKNSSILKKKSQISRFFAGLN
jgi:hypothetical protein